MDNLSKQELFSAVVSSGILVPYLKQDPDLAAMLQSPDHPEIHYFGSYAIAGQLLPALKRRLEVMIAKNIQHNRDAIQTLIAFMEAHPDSEIHDITFNGPTQHYGIRCGVVEDRLQAVCVMTGGHIPNELLGKSIT